MSEDDLAQRVFPDEMPRKYANASQIYESELLLSVAMSYAMKRNEHQAGLLLEDERESAKWWEMDAGLVHLWRLQHEE